MLADLQKLLDALARQADATEQIAIRLAAIDAKLGQLIGKGGMPDA